MKENWDRNGRRRFWRCSRSCFYQPARAIRKKLPLASVCPLSITNCPMGWKLFCRKTKLRPLWWWPCITTLASGSNRKTAPASHNLFEHMMFRFQKSAEKASSIKSLNTTGHQQQTVNSVSISQTISRSCLRTCWKRSSGQKRSHERLWYQPSQLTNQQGVVKTK